MSVKLRGELEQNQVLSFPFPSTMSYFLHLIYYVKKNNNNNNNNIYIYI